MHREINIEKIKTLEKDLSDTISEIGTIIAIEEEVFLKDSKEIYALRYLLIEAVEAMANICNHLLARITGQVPKAGRLQVDSGFDPRFFVIPTQAGIQNQI